VSSRATDAKAGGSSLLVFACKKGVARHWKKGISNTLAEDLNPPKLSTDSIKHRRIMKWRIELSSFLTMEDGT
jgi:hypothetical protein